MLGRARLLFFSALGPLTILCLLPTSCRADTAIERELIPSRFNQLSQDQASQVLRKALRQGLLKFQSTAELAAWLEARPPAWGTGDPANPILAFRSELHTLPPESQAWLLMAVRIRPELVQPSAPRDSAHPVGTFHPAYIGGDAQDLPAAAAIIAQRVRSSLTSRQERPSAEAFPLSDPLAEFGLLEEICRGDPQLAADAAKVASVLKSCEAWSPEVQIALGHGLLAAAKDARTDSARSALVRPGTDAIIEGTAAFYRSRPGSMTASGTISSLFTSRALTREDQLVIREIETRYLERSSHEGCPNFGEALFRTALTGLWTDRFGRGADALCLWYPSHWVPVDEIVATHPEAAIRIVTRPERSGDGLRREILIRALAPRVFAENDFTGSSKRETIRYCSEDPRPPCNDFASPALARAIREEATPPSFDLDLDASGMAIVRFRDLDVEHAWQSRQGPRRSGVAGGPAADLAGLATLLGVAEKDVRALVEHAFLPAEKKAGSPDCRLDWLPAEVWGGPQDHWRLARLGCGRLPRPLLPLESAAWPRNATDEEAFSWLVWSYQPFILADSKGARIVWLPDRILNSNSLELPQITGVMDLDGSIFIITQGFDAYCGHGAPCGRDELRIELSELTQNVFSFPRKSARAKS